MGGKGSGYSNYRIPLSLTKEMRICLIKAMAKEDTSDDFPIALRMLRAGLILNGYMETQHLQSMYNRNNDKGHPLIDDKEVDFYIEKGLISDLAS